jgi:hypothetical protein
MQGNVTTERGGRCLSGVVIRSRPDATQAENVIAACERAPKRVDEAQAIIRQILRPLDSQPARTEEFHYLRKVLVCAFSRKDLVTDDDQAKSRLFRHECSRRFPDQRDVRFRERMMHKLGQVACTPEWARTLPGVLIPFATEAT